jgi:hypothetical protein
MKKFRTTVSILMVMILASPLLAEKRIYRSAKPVGQFIPALIDAMGDAGMRFTVERSYDEKTDGKLGLLLTMKPGNRVVDLGFHDEKGKTTLVTVRFQDPSDSGQFNQLFTGRLQMKEVGLGNIDDTVPAGWPTP